MQKIAVDVYDHTLDVARLKKKFVQALRPKLDLIDDWDEREFVAITDRSGNKGILWIERDGHIYIIPYTLRRGIADKTSGRAKPVICDFCFTQQRGTLAARIQFEVSVDSTRSLLCCADLLCSQHIRGKTNAGLRSKAQLRETITSEEKAIRLRKRLGELVTSLDLEPVV